MSVDVAFRLNAAMSRPFGMSPTFERRPVDQAPPFMAKLELSSSRVEGDNNSQQPAILMRRLPPNTTLDVLRTMLLFAKDLVDVAIVDNDHKDDAGYMSAVAQFRSPAGAHEATERLNGKPISSDSRLVVELYPGGSAPTGGRRNTLDGGPLRLTPSSASSNSSSSGPNPGRTSSRFNGTFQNLEKMSPPNDKFPTPESTGSLQSLFSPQSPVANATVSSKTIINDDPTDETGKLLNDSVAFARNGENAHYTTACRPTIPDVPAARFAALSMLPAAPNGPNGMGVPLPVASFISPRPGFPMRSPTSTFTPNPMTPLSAHNIPTPAFSLVPHYHQTNQRPPPPNPADQNPPCNTLYVGNLPVDTSEDELKAIFSKQRGYKRLCFRTKQNGPLCFVEFEDVSFATKALHELYGHLLHNSVKGGIRLSFSKNPLGVRSVQQNGNGMPPPMIPPPGMSGMFGVLGAPPGFSTATGPPPGLPNPSVGGFACQQDWKAQCWPYMRRRY